MNELRFFVAKYVPDLRRMEPRNMGVVVWQNGEVAARFLAERRDVPGEVDGRSVPAFVTSVSAYKQWVKFWRDELAQPQVVPTDGTASVPKTSTDYLGALANMSRANFHLIEAGMLLDQPQDDLPTIADNLFGTLVEEPTASEESRDPSLEDLCQQLLEDTRLTSLPYFRKNYAVTYDLPKSSETLEFTYAYGNGTPSRLYQQLPLPKKRNRKSLSRNVHHVAWMFEKVIQTKVISPDQGGVLVYPTEEQSSDPDVRKSLSMLGSITRVLNLQEFDRVRDEFSQLANLPVPHDGSNGE